jgi:anti-sigma regulatory factor (Ser/Thr protein kinase)
MTKPDPRIDDRHVDLRVPATPDVVADVRRELGSLGLSEAVLGEARLLVSELVTNSIKHSELPIGEKIRISARLSGDMLRVDVFDRARGQPREDRVAGGIRPGPGAESGWGLFLLDQLATKWGNTPGHYWFEMTVAGDDARTATA